MSTIPSTNQPRINGKPITQKKVAFDGCHKLYLIDTPSEEAMLRGYGYDIHDIAQLPSLWDGSCPLRFIAYADLARPLCVDQGQPAWFSGWSTSPQLQSSLDELAYLQEHDNEEAQRRHAQATQNKRELPLDSGILLTTGYLRNRITEDTGLADYFVDPDQDLSDEEYSALEDAIAAFEDRIVDAALADNTLRNKVATEVRSSDVWARLSDIVDDVVFGFIAEQAKQLLDKPDHAASCAHARRR